MVLLINMFIDLYRVECKELQRLKSRKQEIRNVKSCNLEMWGGWRKKVGKNKSMNMSKYKYYTKV